MTDIISVGQDCVRRIPLRGQIADELANRLNRFTSLIHNYDCCGSVSAFYCEHQNSNRFSEGQVDFTTWKRPSDTVHIIDASKAHLAFFTHRALRHHTQGIFEAERVFGLTITSSAGRVIPLRWIGEQHVKEDCRGKIPSLSDWLGRIQPEAWMANGHIDTAFVPVVGDPRTAWIEAVTQQHTILGFEDWFELHALEQSVHDLWVAA